MSHLSDLCVFVDLSVGTSKDPTFKKPKKKKVLKQQPKQKSAFKLKTTKKPQTFSHHAVKPKRKPKSKPLPKLKHKPLPKLRPIPKPKTKAYSQQQSLSLYRPHLKSYSSDALSMSGASHLKSQPQGQSRLWSTSRRTISHKQRLLRSRSPQPKSQTQFKLHLKSKSRRMLSQYQNMSQPGTSLPKSHPTPQFGPQSSQPVWDTSVQAAIRVGDWKLLTGDPGHGDWVPPQVV